MSKKKYLKKNEFRYYLVKDTYDRNKRPHPAYISVRYKDRVKFNLITHSDKSFDKPTKALKENPNLYDISKISVPKWDYISRFSEPLSKSQWKLSKYDKASLSRWNRKHK